MAANRKKPGQSQKTKVSAGEIRLLLTAALFLGAVLLKVSGAPWTKELHVRTVAALEGGVSAEQIVQAAGQVLQGEDVVSVFAAWNKTEAKAASKSDADVADIYAEAAFAEDILQNRMQAKFPKTVDETQYLLDFSTHMPVNGAISSAFGERIHPISGDRSFHYGMDFAADEGTPIYAFAEGTVRETGNNSYGNYVILDHAQGFSTLYAHCSAIEVQKGEHVTPDTEIARVGATGKATGNHLHLEIWKADKVLNPAGYLET